MMKNFPISARTPSIRQGGKMLFEALTETIIRYSMQIHSALGPGLLESVYRECLFYKLQKGGFYVEKEKPLPLVFEEVTINCGYRMDLVVENKVVIELKSVKKIEDIHLSQILTYMRLGKFNAGLIINFNVSSLKDGIKRVIN
jgi:GxxExxY protein